MRRKNLTTLSILGLVLLIHLGIFCSQAASGPPVIVVQPQSQTVSVRGTATFSVTVDGTTPFSFQWQKDGQAILGATASSYSITGLQLTDSGSYSVEVRNAAGIARSDRAVLTVVGVDFLPQLYNPARAGTAFRMSFPTVSNRVFLVEFKNTLSDAEWKPVLAVVGDGKVNTIQDRDAGASSRFYRLVSTVQQTEIIHGTDDRKELWQATPAQQSLAASVCGLVQTSLLITNANDSISLFTYPWTELNASGLPILPCDIEPFRHQRVAPFCTGFLIGPDLLLTEGHCIRGDGDADGEGFPFRDVAFVFGYAVGDQIPLAVRTNFTSDSIYRAKEIVARKLSGSTLRDYVDYAIIRLDRAVTAPGAKPLKLRTQGEIAAGTKVGIIGHPSGLPLKVAFGTNTHVLQTYPTVFLANTDAYGGNSGSPVFDTATGDVIGIHAAGVGANYLFDSTKNCFYSNQVGDDDSRYFKVVFKVSAIPELTRVPPEILTQPKGLSVPEGASFTVSVASAGQPPLSFQWRHDGVAIVGATNDSYTVSNSQASDAGSYFVTASNSFGSTVSQAVNVGVGFMANEILVRLRADATEAQRQGLFQQENLALVETIQTATMRRSGQAEIYLVQTAQPVQEALRTLAQNPRVIYAERNWIYTHQATPNDPYYLDGRLWGMLGEQTSPANPFGSQAGSAWSSGHTGSRQIYVGVIDEGIQLNHPDLSANIWSNPFDPPDGKDNDGNGYVDDLHGWDFFWDDNSIFDPGLDEDDHGTHVSGTIGAIGGNGLGVAGVNWNVTLISGKFLGSGGGTTAAAIKAVDYFTDLKQRHGLPIVALNNSWGGGGYSQSLHGAILRAAKGDILFVAAAGNAASDNDRKPFYPANYDTTKGTSTETPATYNAVISVAAIDRNGALATFSNYGATQVHLGAPGVGIYSTVPFASVYASYSGTSMAAPHVTGAIALFASTHAGSPGAEIRRNLLSSVTSTPSLAGKTTTGGRLNVNAFMTNGPLPTVPTITAQPQGQTVTAGANVTFTVVATGTAPLSYQWRKNSQNISGVTSSSYTIASVQNSDAGNYEVIVSNSAGSMTSQSATLIVIAPPPAEITHQGPVEYKPGAALEIGNRFAYTGRLLSLLWRPQLPTGWQLLSATGDGQVVVNTSRGEILWLGTLPQSPIQMRYTVQVPAGATGPQTIRGQVEYQLAGMVNPQSAFAAPDPLNLAPPPNQPPIALAQTVSTLEDSPLKITLRGTDPEKDPLTFIVLSQPSKGVLTDDPPNSTYSPAKDQNGPDSFTFQVSDGKANSTPATVTIDVSPVNDPPTLNPLADFDIFENDPSQTIPISGLSSGAANEAQLLSVTVVSSAPNLIPTPLVNYSNPSSTGSLILTPLPNATGTATITVTVKDNGGTANGGQDTTNKTFKVTVTPPPTLSVTDVSVLEGDSGFVNAVFAVSLSQSSPRAVTVNYATADGSATAGKDYESAQGVLTFLPNTTVQALVVRIAGEKDFEANETFAVNLTNPINAKLADGQGQGLIINDDAATPIIIGFAPSSGSVGTDVVISGTSFTGTTAVQFNGVNAAFAVRSDTTIAVTVPATAVTGRITVTTPSGTATSTTVFTVIPVQISVSPMTVTVPEGGNTPVQVRLTAAPAGNLTVTLNKQAGGDPDLTASPASFTFTPANWNVSQPLTVAAAQDDDAVNGTAAFSLTATGLEPVTVQATEADDENLSLIVNPSLLTVNEGASATAQVRLSARPLVDLPVILTKQAGGDADLSASSSAFIFTPANWNVSQSLTVIAAQDNDHINGQAAFTLAATGVREVSLSATETDINRPPTAISPSQPISVSAGSSTPITLTGSDPENDPLTFSIVTPPSKGTLTGTPPNLAYAANASASGTDSFTFKANDGRDDSAPATISISINTGPSVNITNPLNNVVIPAPGTVTVAASATDNDGVAEVEFFDGATSLGKVTTPPYQVTAPLTGGSHVLKATARDTKGASGESVPVTIRVNRLPTASIQTVDVEQGAAKTITLTGNDTDNDPLTFSIVALPAKGALSGTPPNLNYTANATATGTDSFTFKANDGFADSTAAMVTINLIVSPPPVANPQSIVTPEDTPLNLMVTGSDSRNRPLTFTVVSQPAKGTLSGTPPSLTYTPSLNENGSDSFMFKVNNGLADSTSAAVNITITPVNDPPTMNSLANVPILENAGVQTVQLSGITTGAANENQTLTVTASSSDLALIPTPIIAYVSPISTGSLTFLPASGRFGMATITVNVKDDGGSANGGQDTISRSFTVTVAPRSPIIVTQPQSQTVNLTGTASFSVTADGTPPLSYQWRKEGVNRPGATASTLTIPNAQVLDAGNYDVIVSNTSGSATSQVARLTVNTPPSISLTETQIMPPNTNRTIKFQVSDSESGANQLVVTRSSSNEPLLPISRVTLGGSGSERSVLLEPTANATGQSRITLVVSDPGGLTATSSFLVVVNGPVDTNVTFIQLTSSSVMTDGGTSTGGSWADFDGDGDIDLFVGKGINGSGELAGIFRNELPPIGFTKVTSQVIGTASHETFGYAFADYDNDGLLDSLRVNVRGFCRLYRNAGNGTFQDATAGSAFEALTGYFTCAAWADYDRDGKVDVFVAQDRGKDQLYRNNGNGTFTRIAFADVSGGEPTDGSSDSYGAAWSDYDSDGFPDLFICRYRNSKNILFRNKGNGTFSRVSGPGTPDDARSSYGCAWGDLNNDGHPDLVVANSNPSFLFLNNGNGSFTRLPDLAETGFTPVWADFDNDGWLDLFMAGDSVRYRNNKGKLEKVEKIRTARTLGASAGDLDNDGFADLYVGGEGDAGLLLRNNANRNHWLKVRCQGTSSNRAAIGARVKMKAYIDGNELWQLREIVSGNGLHNTSSLEALFGLGDATIADTLRIEWPSGKVTELRDVPSNQTLKVTEP